jgi:hypothetical protein
MKSIAVDPFGYDESKETDRLNGGCSRRTGAHGEPDQSMPVLVSQHT